jgi:hypothetical protein
VRSKGALLESCVDRDEFLYDSSMKLDILMVDAGG